MLLTSDGHFIAKKNIQENKDGIPFLTGDILIPLNQTETETLSSIVERSNGNKKLFYNNIKLLGRSGHAQVGIETTIRPTGSFELSDDHMRLPIKVLALGEIRQQWLETLQEVSKKFPVRIGRLLILDQETRFNKSETERAFKDKWMYCKNSYEINDDGSVSIYPEKLEFIYDQNSFEHYDTRRSVLIHSRNALKQYLDVREVPEFHIRSQSLAVLGIRLSSGPFPIIIRHDINNQLMHLHGGLYLDAFRTTKIGTEYGASGLRQIEIFNHSETDYQNDKIKITVDVFPTPKDKKNQKSKYNDIEQRAFWHLHGSSFVFATNLQSPNVQNLLYDKISPYRQDKAYYGRIITDQGVSNIPWATTKKFQKSVTEQAVKNPSGVREKSRNFLDVIKRLRSTVEQGRVFISHALPDADELLHLANQGISSFIFKGMKTEDMIFAGKPSQIRHNAYMTAHLYETILHLYKRGVSFTFIFHSDSAQDPENTHVLEFFKGFWCRPEAKQRLDEVEVILDVYGWHHNTLSQKNKMFMKNFLTKLSKHLGKNKLAVMHGKGPGFMLLADQTSRKLDILSIGIGIDVEKVDQAPNFEPDVLLDFDSSERLFRQKLLDHLGTIKLFNIGGFGTLEEAAISVCSKKLLEIMPSPMLFVDASGSKTIKNHSSEKNVSTNHWKSLVNQFNNISNTNGFEYAAKNGTSQIDISAYPLGPRWITKICHCVNSYDEGADILINFLSDPAKYWQKIGLTEKQDLLELAWQHYQEKMEYYQLRVYRGYREAMELSSE